MKKYPQIIEPATGTIVLNKKEVMLPVTGEKWKGAYTIPGGHIEYGEKIMDAAKRELKEEIGVVPDEIKFLSIGEAVFPDYFHRKAHFIFVNFVGIVEDVSRITLCEREFSGHLWIAPRAALASARIVPSARALIEEYVEQYER